VTEQTTETPPTTGAPPTTSYGGDGPSGPRAGFWRRFAALFIDVILLGVVEGILTVALHGAGQAISLVISAGYFTYFEGGPNGQTVGKMALGIRVIDFQGGGSIGFGRGFIRWIARYLSAIVFLLGYFWMLWDREKQCWHDKLANDVVVPVDAYPVNR
jgi:uncharacterized RDD family membrane protein YckC